MRAAILVGIAACGFSGPTVTSLAPIAASIDAPAVAACHLTATDLGAATTVNLGEQVIPPAMFMHGAMQPPIACMAGELPIGIGTYTTIAPVFEGNTERVVRSMTVRCGTVGFTAAGSMTITAAETIQTPYGGCIPSWGSRPSVDVIIAPPVSCPAGQLPTGLTAHGGADSLFNTVAVACAPVSPSGSVAAVADSVPVVDSGNYLPKPQLAICPPNQAFLSFTWRGDCGVDEWTPVCAALSCR